jgi:hypothetical protein
MSTILETPPSYHPERAKGETAWEDFAILIFTESLIEAPWTEKTQKSAKMATAFIILLIDVIQIAD